VRPYIRTFDNSENLNSLPNKEVCIAMSWSGDYVTAAARAAEAGVKVNLAYTVPKEGASEWFDALLVPKGAPHFENAMKFLNFMMDPKVIAEVTNDIRYGNDNLAANAYVDPGNLANPAIYPTPEVEKRLYTLGQATPAVGRLRTRSWTRIKTGH
jgi:putrescine transport system substrate-binding protein